jgi:hypothetical protein
MPSFPIREGHRSKRNLFKQRASPVVNLDRKHKRLPCLVLDFSKGGFRLRGSFLVRTCLLIGLVYCMYLAGKRGISAWYLRQSSAAALESAIAWDAANPQNFDDLGTLIHTYGDGGDPDRIIQSYQTATRLSPQNALYWADLGAAYDWAGRQNEAISAFHRALKLFPNSPDINWRVANFCIRTGKTAEGFQSLRKVLLGGSVPRPDVFALAARATHNNRTILDEVLLPDTSIFADYLNFQIGRDDIGAAEQVWHRLLELKLPFDLRQAFPYLDALIRHRKLAEVSEAWSLLRNRFPSEVSSDAANGNLVVNGSFEHEILNGGFDWRVVPTKGASVSLDTENRFDGARSLRIDFDSTENPYYCYVFQYVAVKPETRYHFSGYLRVKGITTDSGPAFEVSDAYDTKKLFLSADGLVGTSDWSLQEFEFKTQQNTQLLIVRVSRRPSHKLANQIAGTVWVDNVKLETKN